MAYRQPGVTVTQIFQNALPALAVFALPNVTVGPIFQIVSASEAGSYSGDEVTLAWPEQILGTTVDLSEPAEDDLTAYPPVVQLEDTLVAIIADATTGNIDSGEPNLFTDATEDQFENILAGDVIQVTSGGNAGNYTVREVIDVNTLKINETFVGFGFTSAGGVSAKAASGVTAQASGGTDYSILRNIGTVTIPSSTSGL